MTQAPTQRPPLPSEDDLWELLLALSELARGGTPVETVAGLRLTAHGTVERIQPELGWLSTKPMVSGVPNELLRLLSVYLPLCVGPTSAKFVLGHLGQSLDGQIATASGASRYVTGPENLKHMHRLRALCDAVIVGVSTVAFDNPKLTTRLVRGRNPVRVILDPELRAPAERAVFSDQQAETLVITANGRAPARRLTGVDLLEVPVVDGVLSVDAVVAGLERRRLRRLFIEGGGVTVSHFLAARALTRLHLTISPVFLGSGRPGIVLPPILDMNEALRPASQRYNHGQDVLFDFDFTSVETGSQRVVKRV